MITLAGVGHTYPGQASASVRALDWHVPPGAFVLVVGASGSGKTTVLRTLNGLVPHFHGGRFAGSVHVNGLDAIATGPAGMCGHVGVVFQEPEAQAVLPTVEDDIAFGLETLAIPPRAMRRRVEEALDLLGLAHLRRRAVATLSGGERQRLAIAAVMAQQPRVLVLDEPTSQLDPLAADELLAALTRLNHDLGTTIVLAEHRLERALPVADRLLYLPGDGQRAVDGATRQVIRQLPLAPAVVHLGRHRRWQPLPLSVGEARRHADGCDWPAPNGHAAAPRRATGQPSLAVHNLTFRYPAAADAAGPPILNDVAFRLPPGEVVALMGRNGTGKTTLLRVILGLLQAEKGAVEIAGRDVTRLPTVERAHLVGFVPQRPSALLFAETVQGEFGIGREPRPDAAVVRRQLAAFGLAHLAERYPRDLSVGEQQRLALALATARRPAVLLLDEPTRGLDYRQKANLAEQLRQLADAGASVLVATHDVELVAASAQRVLHLADGEIVADGTPREVLAGSLTYATQVNRLLGGHYLTLADAGVPQA